MLQRKVCGVSAAALLAGLACAAALAEQADCFGQACAAEETRAGLVQVRKRKLAKRQSSPGAAAVNASAGAGRNPIGSPCTADSDCTTGRCAGNAFLQGGTCGDTGSSIDITLTDVSGSVSDGQDAIKGFFTTAREKYLTVIKGHWFDKAQDITIEITWELKVIDGPGQILGGAGPTTIYWWDKSPTYSPGRRALPSAGEMIFDVEDLGVGAPLANLAEGVILHEMAHVIGLGTMWNLGPLYFSFTPCVCDAVVKPASFGHYATPEGYARTAYERLPNAYLPSGFDCFGQTPPVEKDQGGCGTLCSHWSEAVFETEIMTGFASEVMEFSDVSVGGCEDVGYVVDYSAADPYTLPTPSGSRKDRFEINKHILRPGWTAIPAGSPDLIAKVRASSEYHWNQTQARFQSIVAARSKFSKLKAGARAGHSKLKTALKDLQKLR